MHRITISLPEDMAGALHREARRRAVPVSGIARDALSAYLGLANADDRRTLAFVGVGRSGHRTTARDMEELLAVEWNEHAGRR